MIRIRKYFARRGTANAGLLSWELAWIGQETARRPVQHRQ